MNRCYRIKARPFWNHWQVATSFFGNMLALGSLACGAITTRFLTISGAEFLSTLLLFGSLLAIGVALESVGLFAHGRAMKGAEHEGAASHYIQQTTFGKTYLLRNGLLAISLLIATALLSLNVNPTLALTGWGLVGLLLLVTSVIGRALFYVLVVPTTMPGAFFWKNKGFEEHARDIGLAEMPQVGVVPASLNH